MRWMSSRMPSTSRATSFLYCSSFGFAAACGTVVDVVDGGAWAAVSETVTAAIAATIQTRDRRMGPPGVKAGCEITAQPLHHSGGEFEFCSGLLERDSRTDSHDARGNYVQRPQERGAGVEARVLLRVRVEEI